MILAAQNGSTTLLFPWDVVFVRPALSCCAVLLCAKADSWYVLLQIGACLSLWSEVIPKSRARFQFSMEMPPKQVKILPKHMLCTHFLISHTILPLSIWSSPHTPTPVPFFFFSFLSSLNISCCEKNSASQQLHISCKLAPQKCQDAEPCSWMMACSLEACFSSRGANSE